MTRFASICAVLLTSALGTMVAALHANSDQSAGFNGPPPTEDQIAERSSTYFPFKYTLDNTIDLLANNQITLANACDRVCESALCYFPDHLKNIEESDPAPTAKERIARNLLGHLYRQAEEDATLAPRLRALELEFAVLTENNLH